MESGQVKEFTQAVGKASWNLDLWRFAEAIGSDADHHYTKDKFRQFQALGKALGQFDAETLTKIINHAAI